MEWNPSVPIIGGRPLEILVSLEAGENPKISSIELIAKGPFPLSNKGSVTWKTDGHLDNPRVAQLLESRRTELLSAISQLSSEKGDPPWEDHYYSEFENVNKFTIRLHDVDDAYRKSYSGSVRFGKDRGDATAGILRDLAKGVKELIPSVSVPI